ncbi:MAG: phage tail sheath subtilisin-like domain-containing protein [Anaerolineae bacterium]|jgi:hypothetical protein
MAVETILPGVYIEVRPEGLMAPGFVTVGNLGVVGTASKGPIGEPTILGSYTEARERFGDYDVWIDGNSDELTLVRALEQAYAHGATTVIAVRVASDTAAKAGYILSSASGVCVGLTAKTEGTWGNDLAINVGDAEEHAFIENEEHLGSEGPPIALSRTPVVKSARNRIQLFTDADGLTRSLQVLYDDDPAAPGPGQVKVDRASGEMVFGDAVAAADTVTASYVVNAASAVKVTIRYQEAEETYTVVDGDDLVADINRVPGGSAWVDAEPLANTGELPNKSEPIDAFAAFGTGANTRGDNGAIGADYREGLESLLNEPAHIIVAAGQDDSFGDELNAHCQLASSDAIKRERIAVVGSRLGATVDDLRGHNLASDRVIFVAPGIKATDAPSGDEVTLPGGYAAAAVAGLLAGFSAHISLTNKTLRVGGLEQRYTAAQLTQLVLSRVLALEERMGFRVVKGITTATNTAWHQITTRRIVDFAKFGVRSAANPYIGRLNNERVRGALKVSINSFLSDMVTDEMLISYELEVSATRDEEIRGIARVEIILRPTFSIDFIKVTMFLE